MERGGIGEGELGKKKPAVPVSRTADTGVCRPAHKGGFRGPPSQEEEVIRTYHSINISNTMFWKRFHRSGLFSLKMNQICDCLEYSRY